MEPITKLTVKNFQKHAHRTLELGNGVNTIVGPTDKGKSALLRAFQWVCQNKPSGDQFIKNGTKETEVIIETENTRISRRKTKAGGNHYTKGDASFTAFGNGVPQEVQEALQVTDANFQGQHDAPFWFSLTPGEVSRKLNEVINLSVIDSSLSYAASKVREYRTAIAINKERYEEAKAEKSKKFDGLKDQSIATKKLRALFDRFKQHHDKTVGLKEVVQNLQKNEKRLRSKKKAAEKAEALIVEAGCLLLLQRKTKDLSNTLSRIKKTKRIIASRPPPLDELETLASSVFSMRKKKGDLAYLVGKLRQARSTAKEKREEAKKAEERFHSKIEGQKCPLCDHQL